MADEIKKVNIMPRPEAWDHIRTPLSPIVTGLSNPIGITMDQKQRQLYYTECFPADGSGAIWESDMDGAGAMKIATTSLSLGVYFVAD